MKLNNVTDMEIKFNIHVISHKIYSSSQPNIVFLEAVDLAYKVVKKNFSFDLAELQHIQLSKNIESIWVSKNNSCKFGSLLVYLFFCVQKLFPSKGNIVQEKDTLVLYQINEFIDEMGENFEGIMDAYFEKFKGRMHSMFRIPKQLVDDYEQNICFLVGCDKVHIQVVRPRIAWVKPLEYEVNIDETRDIIEDLINELVDPKDTYF